MTEPKKFLFEVAEVSVALVRGYIRKSNDELYMVYVPRFMCPDIACIPGGSFYIQAEPFDPVEEQKELDRLFRGI